MRQPGFRGCARQEKAEAGSQGKFSSDEVRLRLQMGTSECGGKLEEKNMVRKTVNEG